MEDARSSSVLIFSFSFVFTRRDFSDMNYLGIIGSSRSRRTRPYFSTWQSVTSCLSKSVIVLGQSNTKWLKRAEEITDPCGVPACTWQEGELCCWLRHGAFLPRSPKVCYQPSNHVVSESGAVDHLYEEAV